ncbi:hypothetical protein YC2023_067848 [Brassica napus]
MSHLNIDMKKNSMRKNKKLVINIASRKKEFEANHQDLGSSIKDEKKRVGDGVMREVDVGTGLSGALKLLREQGTFKEIKSSSKHHVRVRDINHGKDNRFKDAFKDIRIDRVDECGRIMTEKEAFKKLCHGFHGKKPGKRKQEKRMKKYEDSSRNILESSDRAVERMRQVHAELKSPYIFL